MEAIIRSTLRRMFSVSLAFLFWRSFVIYWQKKRWWVKWNETRLVEDRRDDFFSLSTLHVPFPTCQSGCPSGDLLEWQNTLGNMAWIGLRSEWVSWGCRLDLGLRGFWGCWPGGQEFRCGPGVAVKAHSSRQTAACLMPRSRATLSLHYFPRHTALVLSWKGFQSICLEFELFEGAVIRMEANI